MQVRITRKTDMLESLMKRLKQATNTSVSSGYHSGSGIHQESGLSFSDLMYIHEYGLENDGVRNPERPVRSITFSRVNESEYWAQDVKNYLCGKTSWSNSLNKIGMEITATAQSIFGNATYLTDNAKITQELKGGRNTPLLDSGSLRDAWTWKISLTASDF